MLVYDVTSEKSFDNIRNWIRNIEEVWTFAVLWRTYIALLIQTPMGQKKLSILVRCPYFGGWIACKNCSWGKEKTTLLERCPHFMDVTVPLERVQIPSLFSKLFFSITSPWVCPVMCVCVCVQNASSDVDKMILGNKCDLSESRVISTERGKLVWEWRNGRTENDVFFVSSLSLLFLSPLFSSYPFLPPSPFL